MAARPVTAEGRNYVRILELAERNAADLIVLGAAGLGAVGSGAGENGMIGSTTAKVLLHARCDVLIARRALADGEIIAGIDGSEFATAAAARAAELARRLDRPLRLAAVYDPMFHEQVFRAMATSLTPQRQQEVGLAQQESLHDELINDGLSTLYQGFLDQTRGQVADSGIRVETTLLQGKACNSLIARAAVDNPDLMVVGRFGHHREGISLLGSNAEAVGRLCDANVLVVSAQGLAQAPAQTPAQTPSPAARPPADPTSPQGQDQPEMKWDAAAEARLERVPSFVRPMARRAVEQAVRQKGGRQVTEADFEAVARKFGMGAGGSGEGADG